MRSESEATDLADKAEGSRVAHGGSEAPAFVRALRAELLKLKRSPALPISAAIYLIFGLLAIFMLFLAAHPEAAKGLGLVGQKASLSLEGISADAKGLWALFAELCCMGGFIVMGFAAAYVFGREYAEGTAKNAYALPVRRAAILGAKTVVTLLWCVALSLLLCLEAFACAAVLGIGLGSPAEALGAALGLLLISVACFCLQSLVGFVAIACKGYLAAFGYIIATLVVGSVFAHTDWGPYIPWAALSRVGGLAGPQSGALYLPSVLVLLATLVLGFALSAWWAKRADVLQ
jgi:ABC-2 type transport system permease protein